jgi:hypothetical protein
MMDPSSPSSNPYTENQNSRPQNLKISRMITGYFPFQDNSNAWWYTESGGNTVRILVTDTISDDGIIYFRVSFRENRVDTTDDWFKQSAGKIYFGEALAGKYDLFLPDKIDSTSGGFTSGANDAAFAYHDSLAINDFVHHHVLCIKYATPLIHGFDEIALADSIGIIELIDHSGRWPISYHIDSCRISGVMRIF